ncbi:MAG: hypothetical protein K9M36_02860 [Candidatus Pacebacteria bacterium]|nr:hypothetical protein [Candidatus Paceibacterota bacterium]
MTRAFIMNVIIFSLLVLLGIGGLIFASMYEESDGQPNSAVITATPAKEQ